MAAASFEKLSEGFCEIGNIWLPELSADAQGRVAFHVLLRGVAVNLVYCPLTSPEHVFVLFELGPVGRGDTDSMHEMRALLDANHSVLEVHPPVFSRNPATGEAVLRHTLPLFEATPSGLYEQVDEAVEWIARWRENLSASEDATREPQWRMPPAGALHQIA